MNKNKTTRWVLGLVIVAVGLVLGLINPQLGGTFFELFQSQHSANQTDTLKNTALTGPYEIKKVVDGDTIIVKKEEKDVKVRLLGINAPESVHEDEKKNTKEGKESSKWLKELLSSKRVYLEYDTEAQDQYRRDLAYVYLDDQSTMVNQLLIENGLAKVVKIEPNTKYFEELKELEKAAKQNKKGFWGTGFYK